MKLTAALVVAVSLQTLSWRSDALTFDGVNATATEDRGLVDASDYTGHNAAVQRPVAPAQAEPAPAPAPVASESPPSPQPPGPTPAASVPSAVAPTPVSNNGDTGGDDDDDDDGDEDDDDHAAGPPIDNAQDTPYGSNPAKQIDVGPPSKGTDTEPKVTNRGVNLFPYAPEIRDYIVEQHNWARATLVPTEAANMRQLRWNEALAIEASELVDTCVFEHDTENYAYGQNLMFGDQSISKATVESWMKGWVVDEISPSDRAGGGFMDLDHASAVLWATSYYVGCASKQCPGGYLTACNYFTPGNWQGERAYVPGPSCSQCPSQAPYCDKSGKLCTADPNGSTPTSAPQPAPQPQPQPQPPAPTPAPSQPKPVPPPIDQTPVQRPTPAPSRPAHKLCV